MGLWAKGKAKVVVPSGDLLQKKVLDAVSLLSRVVGATLGPSGRPILIERDGLPPLITKDGVTVAKSVNTHDAVDNLVIECVKEVAERTGKQAGDGTTTSIILAEAVVRYGHNWLKHYPNASPQAFLRSLMSDYNNKIKPAIAKMSTPIDSSEMMRHVALLSANGDDLVADAVVEAIIKSGEDGAILLEESSGKETRTTVQEGFAIPKGLDFLGSIANVFITSEKDLECVLDRPLIMVFNGTLRDVQGIAKIINENLKELDVRPMIFVAHDFTDEVKSLFAINFKNGAVKMVPVITPRDGTPMGKELLLQDLAAYSNAKILDTTNLKDAKLSDLGDADKFRMSRWQTVFIGEPDQDAIIERIANIKSQLEQCLGETDKEIYLERIARLTGGVTTIFVGGLSDLEVREAKARVEDAVCAVRAALKQGVVPGGATTLLRLSRLDIHIVLKQAFLEPIKRLLDNAGMTATDFQFIVSQIEEGEEDAVYDVSTHTMCKAWDRGILDPAKVIDTAIGNALSVAGTLVTLGGVVVAARDVNLENQAALSELAMQNMMSGGME